MKKLAEMNKTSLSVCADKFAITVNYLYFLKLELYG